MEKYHWYLYLPDISLRKFNTTLVDEFEGMAYLGYYKNISTDFICEFLNTLP